MHPTLVSNMSIQRLSPLHTSNTCIPPVCPTPASHPCSSTDSKPCIPPGARPAAFPAPHPQGIAASCHFQPLSHLWISSLDALEKDSPSLSRVTLRVTAFQLLQSFPAIYPLDFPPLDSSPPLPGPGDSKDRFSKILFFSIKKYRMAASTEPRA